MTRATKLKKVRSSASITKLLAAGAVVLSSATSSIAQEIDIGKDAIQVELAPGTFSDGLKVDFGKAAVSIELRATGAAVPLDEQCTSFADMRDQNVVDGRAALRFPPLRPTPVIAYSLRPVTPGWSERWQAAFASMELPPDSRVSAASSDWRPDVTAVNLGIDYDGSDDILKEAIEQLEKTSNEALFLSRANLRDPGVVTVEIPTLLAACALLEEEFDFTFRHILKGPNLISEMRAFDGKLDRRVLERAEDAIVQDNSPSGIVNRELPLVMLVRLVNALDNADIDVGFDEISILDEFSNSWSETVARDFRRLSRPERNELLGSLVEEEVTGLYFEHTGVTTLEARLTD